MKYIKPTIFLLFYSLLLIVGTLYFTRTKNPTSTPIDTACDVLGGAKSLPVELPQAVSNLPMNPDINNPTGYKTPPQPIDNSTST